MKWIIKIIRTCDIVPNLFIILYSDNKLKKQLILKDQDYSI